MKRLLLLLCLTLAFAGCKKSESDFTDAMTGTVWAGIDSDTGTGHRFSFHANHNCTYEIQPQSGGAFSREIKYNYNQSYQYVRFAETSGELIGIATIENENSMYLDFGDETGVRLYRE